jgi:hypothetical protein
MMKFRIFTQYFHVVNIQNVPVFDNTNSRHISLHMVHKYSLHLSFNAEFLQQQHNMYMQTNIQCSDRKWAEIERYLKFSLIFRQYIVPESWCNGEFRGRLFFQRSDLICYTRWKIEKSVLFLRYTCQLLVAGG